MKAWKLGFTIASTFSALGLLAGCGNGSDDGAPIPTAAKPPTQQQLDAMPPEARQAAQNAQREGDFQSQQMAKMAAAQRASKGGP